MSYPEEPKDFSIDDFCKIWKVDPVKVGDPRFPQSPKGVCEAERSQMFEIIKESDTTARSFVSRLPSHLRMSPGWENIELTFSQSSTGIERLLGTVQMDIPEQGIKDFYVELSLSEFGEGLLLLQCRYHDVSHDSDEEDVWHDGVWHAMRGVN